MEINFKIVVTMFNVEKWAEKTVKSVVNQEYSNFSAIFVDDISTDNTAKIVSEIIEGDDRFTLVKNTEKKYSLKNIYDGINILNPDTDDVIVSLDGDDWLANPQVLSKLNNIYNSNNCWVTYGSYLEFPTGNIGIESSPYPTSVITNNSYRKEKWRASHLRTFKYGLWNKIKYEDFLYLDDKFCRTCIDKAFMYPLLEMAGSRAKYVSDILYIYNLVNPNNVHKVDRTLQLNTDAFLQAKIPYSRVDQL